MRMPYNPVGKIRSYFADSSSHTSTQPAGMNKGLDGIVAEPEHGRLHNFIHGIGGYTKRAILTGTAIAVLVAGGGGTGGYFIYDKFFRSEEPVKEEIEDIVDGEEPNGVDGIVKKENVDFYVNKDTIRYTETGVNEDGTVNVAVSAYIGSSRKGGNAVIEVSYQGETLRQIQTYIDQYSLEEKIIDGIVLEPGKKYEDLEIGVYSTDPDKNDTNHLNNDATFDLETRALADPAVIELVSNLIGTNEDGSSTYRLTSIMRNEGGRDSYVTYTLRSKEDGKVYSANSFTMRPDKPIADSCIITLFPGETTFEAYLQSTDPDPNTGNNSKQITIATDQLPADITLEYIALSASPDEIIPIDNRFEVGDDGGVTAYLFLKASNIGHTPAPETSVRVTLIKNGLEEIIDSIPLQQLEVGDSTQLVYEIPSSLEHGVYSFEFYANPANLIPESNENNNTLEQMIIVVYVPPEVPEVPPDELPPPHPFGSKSSLQKFIAKLSEMKSGILNYVTKNLL